MNKKWLIGILTVVLIIAGGIAVTTIGSEQGSHSVTPEEGGEWDYGASGGRTWSNFRHEKPHHSTVKGHEFVDSGCAKPGQWARVEAPSRWISILGDEQDKGLC